MVANRHGGYRDQEFRDRESDVEVSRRKDSYLDRYGDGDRDRDRGHGRDLRDRVRDRQRDTKKRDSLNGYHRSPLSTSNSSGGGGNEQKRSRLSGRLVDREPGELSSGSGSDDPEVPESQVRDNGSQGKENGALPSPSRKRKFSPIVWDRDDNNQSSVVSSRNRDDTRAPAALPPPPPLTRGYVPPNSIETVWQSMEQQAPVDVRVSIDSPHDQQLANDHEPGQMEDEDEEYPTARNISTSRWANGNNELDDDEAEFSDGAVPPKRRKNTPVVDTVDKKSHKKVPSPEPGELVMREGSEGAASKSSASGGEHGDEHHGVEVDRNGYMDVDMEEVDEDASGHLSQSDSETEGARDETPEPAQPPQRCIDMLQGCRRVDEFERLNKIDEGTYGVVYRAKDKKTGDVVALKKVKMEKEREGFPLTSLREINILLSFHHPSIVDVKEVVVGSSLDSIFMVMEYMEHDLKGLMETMKQPFSQSEVKCLMLQLLEGVKYLHDNWVLHRDLKTSNLLLNNRGELKICDFGLARQDLKTSNLLLNNRGELKICDFGLARQYGSPLKPYTHLVVTLWYRAPELLLGAKEYSTAIDMWSLGCIMAELLAKEPLFNGKTEFDQLDKIFRTLGTPNEKIWPGFAKLPGIKVNFVKQPYNRLREKFPPTSFSGRPTLSEAGFDLLNKLLTYDPEKRITADAALKHPWFSEVPLPKSKEFMPTFPAQHAQDRDLKTSNLLLNNRGELKICDFGLARQYGSPLKPYTHLVVTLWYRAPELLLGAKEYSTAIDMWSLGCIMAELLAKEPLFNGKTEFDQLDKIFRTLGTPNEKIWPGFAKLPGIKVNFVKQPYNRLREKFPPTSFSGRPTLSEAGFDLLNKLLTYDPEKRITADAALKHPWFSEVPLPKSKEFMPTFPAQHAQDRRLRRIMKSPDPLEEQRRKELQQGELGTGSIFG
ncbi:putative Cyclin-dependent kinase G-2 [Cocos nucifera]|nr:putative Cyclin-dependent kinase G-2 [Cocos nucifera]